jgi:DNA polymerase-3 subunit delta
MHERPSAAAGTSRAGLPPLTWIDGDEALLVIEAADRVRATARAAGFEQRDVFTVDRGFGADALLAQTTSMSLFATRRLIELRLASRPTREFGEALERALASLDDDTRLLVCSPRLERAVTETAWFGALARRIVREPIAPVGVAQLPAWIGSRLGAQRQQADPDTLRLIAERVEGNLLAAHQEVLKLGLLQPPGRLDPEAVRASVLGAARYDAFGMAQAMVAGDAARALRALDGLRAEGQPAPLVLWALADAIRSLLRLSQARDAGHNPASMTRELRLFPPRDRLFLAALRRLDSTALSAGLQEAARIDRIVKGLVAADPWQAMAALVARMAGIPIPVAPA